MKPVLTQHNQHLFNVTPYELHQESPPSQRLGKRAGDHALEQLDNAKNPWHESPEEVEAGLQRGAIKEQQLKRVARIMAEVLTPEQRVTLELRYTYRLTYREIAAIMERDVSTIHRRIQRSIRKIRKRVEAEDRA